MLHKTKLALLHSKKVMCLLGLRREMCTLHVLCVYVHVCLVSSFHGDFKFPLCRCVNDLITVTDDQWDRRQNPFSTVLIRSKQKFAENGQKGIKQIQACGLVLLRLLCRLISLDACLLAFLSYSSKCKF